MQLIFHQTLLISIKTLNSDKAHCQIGNIFNLKKSKQKNFDGIYNLGVMEHFLEDDILKILNEFNKVLKINGKIILFWPPLLVYQ